MIIHINAKTSPFNGLQNIQQGWRFGGGKSRKEFCQLKKTFDKCWILTLGVKPGFEIHYLLSHFQKY